MKNEMNPLSVAAANAASVVDAPANDLQRVASNNSSEVDSREGLLPIERATLPPGYVHLEDLLPNDRDMLIKYKAKVLNTEFMSELASFKRGQFRAILPRFALVNPFKAETKLIVSRESGAEVEVAFTNSDMWTPLIKRKFQTGEMFVQKVTKTNYLRPIAWGFLAFALGTAFLDLCSLGKMPESISYSIGFLLGLGVGIYHGQELWAKRKLRSFEMPVRFKEGAIPASARALMNEIQSLGTVGLIFEADNSTYVLEGAKEYVKPRPNPDPLIVLMRNNRMFLMGSFDMTSAELRTAKSFAS